jgi:hypothetical protein
MEGECFEVPATSEVNGIYIELAVAWIPLNCTIRTNLGSNERNQEHDFGKGARASAVRLNKSPRTELRRSCGQLQRVPGPC